MNAAFQRLPENAPGDWYVDAACIDCTTCTWVAPDVFAQGDGASHVHRQPADAPARLRAAMAMLACPVAAIGSVGKPDLAPARAAFPERIDGPVHHCGWHAAASFGAASYLVLRADGNILVDSPRFTPALAGRIEALGGIALMFLTHRDDVADHARFAARFGCRRIMHRGDIGAATRDVEEVFDGSEACELAPGIVAIPVPGHTRGSACLLVDDTWLFTGDHLVWDPAIGGLAARRDVCWYDWNVQTASMARLRDYRFEWVLPGHGHRGHLPAAAMRRSLAACVARMRAA